MWGHGANHPTTVHYHTFKEMKEENYEVLWKQSLHVGEEFAHERRVNAITVI